MISVLPIIDAYTLNSRLGRSLDSHTQDKRKREKPVGDEGPSFKKILFDEQRKQKKV